METIKEKILCNICKTKYFKFQSRLELHTPICVTRQMENKVGCLLCDKRYKDQRSLSRHMKHEHTEEYIPRRVGRKRSEKSDPDSSDFDDKISPQYDKEQENTLVSIDVETNSLDHGKMELINMTIVEGDKEGKVFTKLYEKYWYPIKQITESAFNIHGLDKKKLKQLGATQPFRLRDAKTIGKVLEGRTVIAFGNLDGQAIVDSIRLCKTLKQPSHFDIPDFIDVQAMYYDMYPNAKSKKISLLDARTRYGFKKDEHQNHLSYDDALMNYELYQKMIKSGRKRQYQF